MDDDFYEDDEPIEKIRADYEAGEKGITTGHPTIEISMHSVEITGAQFGPSAVEVRRSESLTVSS